MDAIGTIGVAVVVIGLAIAAAHRAFSVITQAKSPQSPEATVSHKTETAVAFGERETIPNIMIGAATTRKGEIRRDTIGILNMGGGPAHDLRLVLCDHSSSREIPLAKKALVAHDILPVPFIESADSASRFQLRFRTNFGTQYCLEFEWNANASRAFNEKLTVISPGALAP